MSPTVEANTPQGIVPDRAPIRSNPIEPNGGHQDKEASHDSELKAIWDQTIGDVNAQPRSYCKAVVLLLSWDKEVDDLKTDKEVSALEDIFKTYFNYETVRQTLGKNAKAQVNKFLADFVLEYDHPKTLLIVYYAGHGTCGGLESDLRLIPNASFVEGKKQQDVIWSSAEHIIKDTQSDVLVIFDCCHAGALDQNRAPSMSRAFEYLAATSADSTTKKPGKESFTSALIWALKKSLKGISTQHLVSKVKGHEHFPKDQCPRLSERGGECLRRIFLAPIGVGIPVKHQDDILETPSHFRQDLSIRFVYNIPITKKMVKKLSKDIKKLHILHGGDNPNPITVLWEGINRPGIKPFDGSFDGSFNGSSHVTYALQKWLQSVRNKAPQTSYSGSPSSDIPNGNGAILEPEMGERENIEEDTDTRKRRGSDHSSIRKRPRHRYT